MRNNGTVVIPRDAWHTALDASASPAATVESGATVVFETNDEIYERLAHGADPRRIPIQSFNRVTGPLAIRGCEPGDAVRIEVLSIEITRAWLVFLRHFGPLGTLLPRTTVRPLALHGQWLVVSDRLRLPVRPAIGCIGLAPSHGASSTFRPVWPWGGNLDLAELGTGSVLWLPVQRPGGYLYLGDVHAAIGAGEPAHVAIEAVATVTVRVTIERQRRLRAPHLVHGDELAVVGIGSDLRTAQGEALAELIEILTREFGLTAEEAYAVVCAATSFRFGGPAGPIVLATVPLGVLPQRSGTATPS